MNKKRVLYYVFTFGNTPFIQTQIESALERFDVHVLCNEYFSDGISNILKDEARITVLPYPEPAWCLRIRRRLEYADLIFNYYNPIFSFRVKRFIDEYDPEIIHCQFGYDALILFDNYTNTKRKIVVTFRGFDASVELILKTYRRKLQRLLLRPNVFPIFVSGSLKRNLIASCIRFNEINIVLYSNVDTDFYSRSSSNHERDLIIFTQVSNFREKKGHYYTVRAFERLLTLKPGLKFNLVFVGAIDTDGRKLISEIKDSPVYPSIIFEGRLPAERVKEVLERSHYFIHNSVTSRFKDQEGIPNAILEAMSMELPIITTRHSGIVELEDGDVDVFYSEERDIEGYAKAMVKALDFKGYSKRNRKRIVTSFSKMRFALELAAFYDKVFNSSH